MAYMVSVVIPCYNASKYIRQTLDSILGQTYRNIEVIIVNDGSTDDSETIIQSYTDERIRYYTISNQGTCKASNFGLSKATGDYIKFFDADDLMNKEHIELQLKKLDGNNDSLASCEWGRFYDNDPASAKFIPDTVWHDMDSMQWIKKSLQQDTDMMSAWVWLIPRAIIEKAGGLDERFALNNDFEFSVRLLTNAKNVFFAEGAKVYYRSGNRGSLSSVISEAAYEKAILCNEVGCDTLLKVENSEIIRTLCADRFQTWLFRIYPHYPQLCNYLENKIKQLGGSKKKAGGGRFFVLSRKLLGWKFAKQLKLKLAKIGYKKLPFN